MNIKDFDYHLPQELIAQFPVKRRDQSRLLIINRKNGNIRHGKFSDIKDILNKDDALVLNNTKVKAVNLKGRIGERDIEVLLVQRIKKNSYFVKAKPAKKLKPNKIISFYNGAYKAQVIQSEEALSKQMRLIEFKTDIDIENVLNKIGFMPLPPYIKRDCKKEDIKRYQTVYAKIPGAIAAPTAGLHFSKKVLNDLKKRCVSVFYVTLHVGLGTFLPVKTIDIQRHEMHREEFILNKTTARSIEKTKNSKGRVCAVGTTVTRVLETCASNKNQFTLKPQRSSTDLFIYPPYKFKAVDVLLTNFHLPKTTLLMLVCAFASKELIFEAYKKAVEKRYRFFSYGDAMLII